MRRGQITAKVAGDNASSVDNVAVGAFLWYEITNGKFKENDSDAGHLLYRTL